MAKLQSGQLMARLVILFLFQTLTAFASIGQNGIPPGLKTINLGATGSLKIEDIFKLIEKRSDFTFSYHKGDLGNSLDAVVWINPQESNIYQALTAVSKAEKLIFKWVSNTINVLKDQSSPGTTRRSRRKKLYDSGKSY